MARRQSPTDTDQSSYDASSLAKLEGLDAVRKRPGMYIGSTDGRGLQHCLWEIIDNSVDEAIAGHAHQVTVTLHADGSAEVIDDGRGIPVDIEPKSGLPGVVLVMTELHAGGKFGGDGYKVAGGLHGVGASVVNALSEKMSVRVTRGGAVHAIDFRRGIAGHYADDGSFAAGTALRKAAKAAKATHGTATRFWPDRQIFTTDAEFDWQRLCDRARQTTHLVAGLSVTVRDERDPDNVCEETYSAGAGLADLVAHIAPDPLLDGSTVIHFAGTGTYTEKVPVLDDGGELVMRDVTREMDVEIAMRWGSGFDPTIRGFVNVVDTPGGGTHVTGFERSVVKTINAAVGATKLLRASEPAPVRDDILEGLTAAVAVRIAEPQFEGQTKEILGTPAARDIVAKVVADNLTTWLGAPKNRRASRAVLAKIVEASRNRRALREQRDTIRRKNALEASSLPDKLKDCHSTDSASTELILVEGDSALGTGLAARNSQFQAMLPLRGKILNVFRASEKAMLDNAECAAIVTAVGAGSGRSFAVDAMRYGRVVVMCDADVDGAHIRTLLLTLFWRYMRPAVEAGRIFAAVPPLYRITLSGSGEHIYCYSEDEKTSTLERLAAEGKSWRDEIQRFKGLGEMDAEQLEVTTLDPSTRMLRRITADDAEAASALFEILMGSDASARRDWIAAHSELIDPAALDV